MTRRRPQYSPGWLYDVRVSVDGDRKIGVIVLASAVQVEKILQHWLKYPYRYVPIYRVAQKPIDILCWTTEKKPYVISLLVLFSLAITLGMIISSCDVGYSRQRCYSFAAAVSVFAVLQVGICERTFAPPRIVIRWDCVSFPRKLMV